MVSVLRELSDEAVRSFGKHPRTAIIAGIAVALVALRIVWLCSWWLLFAPAAYNALAGSVTCDGMPLEEGTVSLEPAGSRGVAARTARVTDGKFWLSRSSGVVRDVEYIVRVEGFRKTGVTHAGPKPGEQSEEFEQFVLPAFNRESESRVKITRVVLREGLRLHVKGRPATAVR